MKRTIYILGISLLFLFVQCESSLLNGSQQEKSSLPDFVINADGDTIPIGVAFPVQGREFEVVPEITLAKPARKITAHNNIHTIQKKTIIPVEEGELKTIELGKAHPNVPRVIELPSERKRAIIQSAEKAEALQIKDIATHNIRYLDVGQGLKSSGVQDLCLDDKGYIWMTVSGSGVCRYDGQSLTYFGEEEGLFNDNVFEIIKDREGNLWFGGDTGFSKYDGTYFTNYQLFNEREKTVVLVIFEDSQGMIWIGTSKLGMIKYDPTKDQFFQYRSDALFPSVTYTIMEDGAGKLWFGGAGGVHCYDAKSNTFTIFRDMKGMIYPDVTCLVEDEEERIWMGTPEGLSIYDGEAFHNPYFPINDESPYCHFLLKDSKDKIWLATKRQGLIKVEGDQLNYYSTREGLQHNEVLEVMEDEQQQLWVGTQGGGLNRLHLNSFRYFSTNEGMLHSFVDDIIADKAGNIWLANEQLAMYDGTTFHYYGPEQGLPRMQVFSLAKDSASNIWMGMDVGLIKYDGNSFHHYYNHDNIRIYFDHLLAARNGDIWMANAFSGAIKFDGTKFTQFTTEMGLLDRTINHLSEDAAGNIWMATARGVSRYDGRTFTHFATSKSAKPQYIPYVFQDEQQTWIGTSDGLLKYRENKVVPLSSLESSIQEGISAIQKDHKGNLWFAQDKGLSILSEKNESHQKFDGKDELKVEDFNPAICLDSEDQLWLTSVKGLTMLDLEAFYAEKNTFIPKVYLNEIQLNGKSISFLEETKVQELGIHFDQNTPFFHYPSNLSVPHTINHFTFNYIGIDWKTPNKVCYQHQLEGVDKTWNSITKENKVDYRNLGHGNYTFKIRAKNELDKWSEAAEYSFTIRPPWWLTWWAYVLYFLLFCSVLYAISLMLQRRWELRNAYEQKEQEAQRLQELDTFKSRLYTNLTHEFRTPLTVILGMVNQMREAPKQYFDEGTQLIERNGKNLLRLINQLLDLSKLENKSFQLQLQQSDIIAYLRYLTQSFQTYANGKNLSLEFFATQETLVMDFDVEQIKQIMTNLISNAVKYTPSGGAIKVKVKQEGAQLFIDIQDTGVGIAPRDLPHIFDRFYQVDASSTRAGEGTGIGLAHTQELVRLMNGTIQVESEAEKGSTFTIELPIVVSDELETTNDENNSLFLTEAIVSSLNPQNSTIKTRPSKLKTAPSKLVPQNLKLPQLLLIEDNPDVVTYLKACLHEQYQIDVAFNGKIGIEKAVENIPDLIISDVMMPEKDGYEVCDTLKQDERTSHIPIILLTAKADLPSKIVGLRRGADAYLSKPFDKEELLVRLEMMVEKQRKLAAYFGKNGESRVEVAVLEEAVKVEHQFIQKIRKIVEQHYANDQFGLPQLCQKAGMSRSQLYRKMKALIDTSPSDFIRSYRLQQAKKLLETTDLNVSEAAWDTGFTNLTHFAKVFQEEFGVLPSKLGRVND
ncbi:MAG: two-component regulator propeller domain-containing protein [Bacteroidota bacterium]